MHSGLWLAIYMLPSFHTMVARIGKQAISETDVSPKNTIQYNTTSFISNIEHNYIISTIFTQHWDGWKGGGQKNNLIVVHPEHLIFIVNVK